jgi:hypothetical protein
LRRSAETAGFGRRVARFRWLLLAVAGLVAGQLFRRQLGHNRKLRDDADRSWSFEPMAQAIHERWRQEAIAKGEAAPTWRELNESLKESSRDQARHIPEHLRKVGCTIAPLRDWEAKGFSFTDPEIRLLAIAEHDRWNHERSTHGWTLAEKKNVECKQTPYLLPWEQLNERYPDIAELDAVFVRAMPEILASVGLQIIRSPAHSGPPPAPNAVAVDAE